MKTLSIVTILAGFFAVTLSACNSGGSRRTAGLQCPAGDYKPFTMDLPPNQHKLSLDSKDAQIPGGIYTYQGATLYYKNSSDLRLQAQDVLQTNGTFIANLACVRNAKAELTPISVDGIRSLDVDETTLSKILIEVNSFSIGIQNTTFKVTATKSLDKVEKSPSEIYLNKATAFMVATDGNIVNYDIRSSGDDGKGNTYMLQIKLTRAPHPKTPVPAPAPAAKKP